MQLAIALPEFTKELAQGIAAMGHDNLAKALYSVAIAERCICDEPGCLTFYAIRKADAPNPSECQRVVAPAKGVQCVQYIDQKVVWIEAIGRPDDRARLDRFQRSLLS